MPTIDHIALRILLLPILSHETFSTLMNFLLALTATASLILTLSIVFKNKYMVKNFIYMAHLAFWIGIKEVIQTFFALAIFLCDILYKSNKKQPTKLDIAAWKARNQLLYSIKGYSDIYIKTFNIKTGKLENTGYTIGDVTPETKEKFIEVFQTIIYPNSLKILLGISNYVISKVNIIVNTVSEEYINLYEKSDYTTLSKPILHIIYGLFVIGFSGYLASFIIYVLSIAGSGNNPICTSILEQPGTTLGLGLKSIILTNENVTSINYVISHIGFYMIMIFIIAGRIILFGLGNKWYNRIAKALIAIGILLGVGAWIVQILLSTQVVCM